MTKRGYKNKEQTRAIPMYMRDQIDNACFYKMYIV